MRNLPRGERFGREQREDHVLDAETGIDRLQLRREQPCQMTGLAARPRRADSDMFDPAVDPVKSEVEPARPVALAFQMRRQLGGEMFDGAGEIGRLGDRLGEAEPHPPHRRLAHRRQRLRNRAERLIETPRHDSPRNGGRAPRAASDRDRRPGAARPGAARQTVAGVEPQRLDRQRRQRGALLAGAGQRRPAGLRREPRQRRRRAQRAGDRDPVRDALTCEAARQIGREPVLAAPQMGAAGNLDLDAICTVGSGPWAVAAAPFGEPGQRCGVGRRLGRRGQQLRHEATARRRAASPAPARPPRQPGLPRRAGGDPAPR